MIEPGRSVVDDLETYDVLVVGGGNAALCSAIAAARGGASVLVLEAAPKFYRGGNTRHTRNMRCAHDTATEILTGPYTEDEFFEDLLRVTGGDTDEDLARHMIRQSKDMLHWIVEQGVRFQPSIGGTLSLGRTNSFFLGGGRAMLNALYLTAEKLGVSVLYDAEVVELEIDDRNVPFGRLFSRRRAAAREGQGAGGRRGGLRGQYRQAGGGLGRDRSQLPHPRHALQSRHGSRHAVGGRCRSRRRPDPVSCGRHRRPRAEVRRRDHHPAGLRGLRHRRQQARRTLL